MSTPQVFFCDYLHRLRDHAVAAHQRGKTVLQAAREFDLDGFADLDDPDRVLLNVGAVYRELNGDGTPAELELLPRMHELARGNHHQPETRRRHMTTQDTKPRIIPAPPDQVRSLLTTLLDQPSSPAGPAAAHVDRLAVVSAATFVLPQQGGRPT